MNIITRGMSYIEVLVALSILGLIALSSSAITLRIISESKESFLQSLAFEQAHDMNELFLLIPNLGEEIVSRWNEENSHLLPDGFGEIIRQQDDITVRIKWRGNEMGDSWQCKIPKEERLSCLEITSHINE